MRPHDEDFRVLSLLLLLVAAVTVILTFTVDNGLRLKRIEKAVGATFKSDARQDTPAEKPE